ncbi:MAG: hypothetical protein ABFS23_06545 [Pseudomonadota bacterium]
MHTSFSELPGRHERHFRRRLRNPLYPQPVWHYAGDELLELQRRDHEELVAFLATLRELVQRAVDLKPNEQSQVVLDLKTELDKAYEQASVVAGDQRGNKDAIRTLLAVITKTIRASAAGDPLAEQQLDDEEEARRVHYRLLEHILVADLLDPRSLIAPEELAATLLSEEEIALRAALEIFDADQLVLLCRDGRRLLESCDSLPGRLAGAPRRLELMETRRELLLQDHSGDGVMGDG